MPASLRTKSVQIDKVQIGTEGRRSREFSRTTRSPTQNEPRTSCGGNHTRTVSTTCRSNSMRNVDFAHSSTGCRAHRLHPGVPRRSCVGFLLEPVQVQLGSLRYSNETSAVKDDGYLETKDLDETVSELHFSALGAELTGPTQVTQPSRSKTLPRVSTTVIEMQGSAESVVHSGRRSPSLRVFAPPLLWCSCVRCRM